MVNNQYFQNGGIGRMYDYLIVGAGLFGAVFAQQATKSGKRCLVIDRRRHIGGNVYTEPVEGIQVHRYGAHIFHTSDEQVWKYMNQFARFNRYINSPIAVYQNQIYNLPFNMNTFYQLWGVRTPQEARQKIREQVAPWQNREPNNLEEQALCLVGEHVYVKLIKGYTEKQWGRDCRDLPPFIIRRLPLRFTYDNNYFSDHYQGIPEGGYTAMIEKMLAGCEVQLKTNYFDFVREHPNVAKKVVYAGSIDEYFGYRLGVLEYRGLRFETQTLPCDNYQGNAVVNYTQREIPYTRIIEHKHFEFGNQPNTVITHEYPCEWKRGMEPYYPVNNARNQTLYEQYQQLAQQEGRVIFGGRLGEYRYYDMDKTVRSALDTVQKELSHS